MPLERILVMTLTFSLEIERLKDMVENKVTYSFIDKHIQKPQINLHKLSILALIMKESSLPINIQNQYIVATMLVHVALDTHEQIPENNDVEEDEIKRLSKQLSVLGGDYYSSLYYLMLSETKDIQFIQTLASAIKDVNEAKMDLYFLTSSTLDDYIKLTKKIESHIISCVANHIGITNYLTIKMIHELLLLDQLIREKEHIIIKKQPYYFNHKHISQSLLTDLDRTIKNHIKQIEQQLTHTDHTFNEFKKIFENITMQYLVITEEG